MDGRLRDQFYAAPSFLGCGINRFAHGDAASDAALLRSAIVASQRRGEPECKALWMILGSDDSIAPVTALDEPAADDAPALVAETRRLHCVSRVGVY